MTLRVRLPEAHDALARVLTVLAGQGASLGEIELVARDEGGSVRDLTVEAHDLEHRRRIVAAVGKIPDIELDRVSDRTFGIHAGGKLEVNARTPIRGPDDLAMAYTPGVARVCLAIADEPDRSFDLTVRSNTVAVVSDGSAVLGLGDIGPEAAMPVMEGKALLFKEFAGVDAFPLCVRARAPDEIAELVERVAPTFGGINLEDISSPRCFEVERLLQERLDIPVFHDDQHGTAAVVFAALRNALRVTGRSMPEVRAVVSGVGAAGIASTKMLLEAGIGDVIAVDSRGVVHAGRPGLEPHKRWLAEHTNTEGRTGGLEDALVEADVFVGLSAPGILHPSMLGRMRPDPIVLAMANPVPEIMPEDARGDAAVVATGRSDYPNQVNNVLCFPGLFRGALDVRASKINAPMLRAAADAIADAVPDEELRPDRIVPSVFDRRVAPAVAAAVAAAAVATGVARRPGAGSDPDPWDPIA